MNRMKKITITAGLALALTVGLGTTAKSAWAGYLAAPTLSTTSSTGSFSFNVTNGANGNIPSVNGYATAPSAFGNTIPTISALDSFAGANLTAPTVTDTTSGDNIFYSPNGLDLQLVNSMTSSYSILSGTVTGNVISNVFKIGSGATMSGAVPGELVFTYQFDVTGSATNINNAGVANATIADFNNPNGLTYNLGSGILLGSAIGPNFNGDTYTNASGSQTSLVENSLTNTDFQGKVSFAQNNSISSLEYALNTGSIDLGQYTPQFFVASNAFYTSMGTIGLGGSGGTDTVAGYVPGAPEPKTLILFGSGIALLAFMFRRKQENTLSI